AQKEREKEQLGLLGLDDLLQVFGGVLVVEAAGKGRIREDQAVGAGIVAVLLCQRVAVLDGGVLHAVQQHVHAADAQHRVVEVVAVKGVVVKVPVLVGIAQHAGDFAAQVFGSGD